MKDCATKAIEYSLGLDDPDMRTFLQMWMHDDFDEIRKEFTDVPSSVFAGCEDTVQPVIENFNLDGDTINVILTNETGCDGCIGDHDMKLCYRLPECSGSDREDRANVIFVRKV